MGDGERVQGFANLAWQAAFAPSPQWQQAAQQLMAVESQRPKGARHAATSEGKS